MLTEFIDLKTQYAALCEPINSRIQAVLNHGRFIMGPEVEELESRLAKFTKAKHCITVASGTEALLIALMALDIKPGDEVITTPFTFAATAEMVVLIGARPVFVDIQPDTCNIDPARIEAAINVRTRAILPVSLYGQPADMDEINAIAARHSLAVIEDAAQSFGSTYHGRKSGNLSTIGCTSFFPSKPLGCYGDGGALFTNDDSLAAAMREIRVHGQSGRYRHTRIGVGGRMDTLQCAVVLAKFERFEWELQQRQCVAGRYGELFRPLLGHVELLTVKPGRTSAYAQYTIFVARRDELHTRLRDRGIPTAIHYPASLPRQPAYAAYGSTEGLPVSDAIASRVISLPMYPDLTPEIQKQIVGAVGEALDG